MKAQNGDLSLCWRCGSIGRRGREGEYGLHARERFLQVKVAYVHLRSDGVLGLFFMENTGKCESFFSYSTQGQTQGLGTSVVSAKCYLFCHQCFFTSSPNIVPISCSQSKHHRTTEATAGKIRAESRMAI